MKILNVMFSKVNGGLEQTFLNYIPALEASGNQVLSVLHPQAEILNHFPKKPVVTVHNYNQYDLFAIYKLRRLILKEQPDCIITHSYRAAYLLKKTHTKVPKIAVCHVRGHYDFGSDAIIAITDKMRQDIIASGISEKQVFTVPNMIGLPEQLSYQEPVDWEVPVIGACARFAPIKGLDIFLAALAELKKRGISFKAKIAGDGPLRSEYEQQIQAYDLNQDVTLLGWIEDKEAFYQSLDLFCLPSREEAFGLVILESMMHSLPMVLTELSGPLEIVGDSESALFVPSERPIAMADALALLIQDKALARKLSVNAFNRAQHYSTEQVAPRLHEVLEQVRDYVDSKR